MRGASNERSVLVAKQQDVATTKNCSVTNYQDSDSRHLPFGLDKTELREACFPPYSKCSDRKKPNQNL